MYQAYMPFCYYPVKIVFVDDQESFIESTSFLLGKYNLKTFTNPIDALEFLNQEVKKQFSLAQLYEELNVHNKDDVYTWEELQANLLKAIAKPHQQEYAVVICDYQMPLLDGFELFENMRSNYLERILLTGEADFAKAVGAFNKGLIDFYVRKDSDQIGFELADLLEAAVWQYFIKFNPLEGHGDEVFSFLQDAEFASYLQEFLKEKNITEMYLWHYAGDILLINAKGEKRILCVRTQQDMDDSADFVQQDYLEDPSKELETLREEITAGKKMLSFVSDEEETEVLNIFKTFATRQQKYYLAEQAFYQLGKS